MTMIFSHSKLAASLALASLMTLSAGCSELGAGVKKEGAGMSEADIQAKLAVQKTEVEAMLAKKEKEQAATLENIQKARAEAIELAEQNAEKKLAEKAEDFKGTTSLLSDELTKVQATNQELTTSNQKLEAQLSEQDKRIQQIENNKSAVSNELPYTMIQAKHKDLVNSTLSIDAIDFTQPDTDGMITLQPNQVLALISAIDNHAKVLQPYKQDLGEILTTMMDTHRKEFEETANTVFIEAKMRRAHIHLWTEQGQMYMAALSRNHPATFAQWLVRLNDEGLFGNPKASIEQSEGWLAIQVTDTASKLVPMEQHANQAIFSFFKKSTNPDAKEFGFTALPIVGNKTQTRTKVMSTYVEPQVQIMRTQKVNNESFQLVLMDKEGA